MTNINAPVLRLIDQGDAAYKQKDYEAAERFYQQGLDLAERTGADTNYVYSSLAKVYKKLKRHGEAYRYSRQPPTPAGFRDGATCLRAAIKEAKKTNDEALLAETLEELYRLAVLAYLCYGPDDCKTGSVLTDRASIVCEMVELQQIHAKYQTHGSLEGGGLLTETDYKTFASVFGETEKTYNPLLDYATLTREANRRYLIWLKDYFYCPPPEYPEMAADPLWNKMAKENFEGSVKAKREMYPWAISE